MAFDSHFQIQGRRHIKVVTISSGIGWLANVFQWLMSKLFKRYFPRDYRQVPDYGIFLSTMHSCWDGFRRYKFVAFKSYSHDVSERALESILKSNYHVFYLRGSDNREAIWSTDYKRILEDLVATKDRKIGISDDPIFLALLESFGCEIICKQGAERNVSRGMEHAIHDLRIMANASTITSSNYSSFADG